MCQLTFLFFCELNQLIRYKNAFTFNLLSHKFSRLNKEDQGGCCVKLIRDWDYRFSRLCLLHGYNVFQARISKKISRSGDGYFYLLAGLAMIYLDKIQGIDYFLTCLKAFALELPCYFLIKNGFKRARPIGLPVFILPLDRYSMPSGHAAAAMLMASVTASYYPAITIPVFTWAVLIGASRLLLGVHYLTDLIAGAMLGACCAYIALM